MGTYNLFPGLKQILEDKRIRRFGVPEAEFQNYLRAEQFVIDMRGYTNEDWTAASETYNDLRELNLDKPPCDQYVLHILVAPEGRSEAVWSQFWRAKERVYPMYQKQESLDEQLRRMRDPEIKKEITEYLALGHERFIVMLATRGVDKHKYEVPRSRKLLSDLGKAHKKGTGGYTIIRTPIDTHNESGETDSTKRPHFRRGHIRKYAPEDKTRWVWVQSCFVNGEPEVQRKAYLVAA